MRALGVPYSEQQVANAAADAERQAREVAAKVVAEGGSAGLESRKGVALIAYLMRLGTDLDKPVAEPAAATGVASAGEVGAAIGGGE
jgi:cytochrome c oxidase cbb3-type subunit I/II